MAWGLGLRVERVGLTSSISVLGSEARFRGLGSAFGEREIFVRYRAKSQRSGCSLASESGTYKTVEARFWPWLSAKRR